MDSFFFLAPQVFHNLAVESRAFLGTAWKKPGKLIEEGLIEMIEQPVVPEPGKLRQRAWDEQW